MTTALDSNILIALRYKPNEFGSKVAENALEAASEQGGLVIAAPVYAELLAYPGRTQAILDAFLYDVAVQVDWDIAAAVWRLAGSAYQAYANRRRKAGADAPRRLLTDFVIGAHAQINGFTLLTLDQKHYKAAFPRLKLQKV